LSAHSRARGFRLLLDQFYAAVFRAAIIGGIISHWLRLAQALGGQATRCNAVGAEPGHHRLRAFLGQRLVGRGVALIIGVPFDAQLQAGILLEKRGDLAENFLGVG